MNDDRHQKGMPNESTDDRVADMWYERARQFHGEGRVSDARTAFERSLAFDPDRVSAWFGLGRLCMRMGDYSDAVSHLYRAILLAPNQATIHHSLGHARYEAGDQTGALEAFSRSVTLDPENALYLNSLGTVLGATGDSRGAIRCFVRSLRLSPSQAGVYHNLAAAFRDQGRIQASLGCSRQALRITPRFPMAQSCYLFNLPYDPSTTGGDLHSEALRWAFAHGTETEKVTYSNDPNPGRPLRVGYVSADFRGHAAAFHLEPFLAGHDPHQFHVYCYAQNHTSDDVTERFKQLCRQWRPISGLTDVALDAAIRKDEIDVLVDCSGHSAGNRLTALAARPAPVMVATLLGHGGTTGLNTFDAILGDPHVTPPGMGRYFSEPIVRLPGGWIPFQPKPEWPDPFPAPDRRDGAFVIGCVGAPVRISPAAVRMYRHLLSVIPDARLMLVNPAYDDPAIRSRFERIFSGLRKRVSIQAVPGGWDRQMAIYGQMHMVVDTWPVTGGTSTLIPLWMGVPVVTCTGPAVHNRFGAASLAMLGRNEWVASSPQHLASIASTLARTDTDWAYWRHHLRASMATSVLCDANRISRDAETVYRFLWRRWCTAHPRETS